MAYAPINPIINPIGANETNVNNADIGATNAGFNAFDNLR